LAGGIAHDFNNILTVILGNAELMPFELDKREIAIKHIEQIKNAAEKAATLTHQLLAFSRKEIIQPEIINLNKHVSEMQKMFNRIIGEDIYLNVNLDPNLMNVEADHSHLDQIIMNLIINAKDAMPDGGELTIRTKNILINENNLNFFPKAQKGGHVVLEVEDTGTGIENEIISKIFDPFFTTKSSGKGTGLGLSVVDGIVNQNGGWIDVSSEIKKGTIFKIYFPAIDIESDNKIIAKNEFLYVRGNGEKIMVLEDEPGIRDLAYTTLTANGYQVFEVATIKSALSLIQTETGKFDLIFSDIVLPDGSGIDFYEKAILEYPDLKILFTSGYANEKAKWENIQKKNYAFIQKPYKIFELLAEIKKQLI
jgi:two-component system, cell cycle sensor histidine kinase and response regulator CckA